MHARSAHASQQRWRGNGHPGLVVRLGAAGAFPSSLGPCYHPLASPFLSSLAGTARRCWLGPARARSMRGPHGTAPPCAADPRPFAGSSPSQTSPGPRTRPCTTDGGRLRWVRTRTRRRRIACTSTRRHAAETSISGSRRTATASTRSLSCEGLCSCRTADASPGRLHSLSGRRHRCRKKVCPSLTVRRGRAISPEEQGSRAYSTVVESRAAAPNSVRQLSLEPVYSLHATAQYCTVTVTVQYVPHLPYKLPYEQ